MRATLVTPDLAPPVQQSYRAPVAAALGPRAHVDGPLATAGEMQSVAVTTATARLTGVHGTNKRAASTTNIFQGGAVSTVLPGSVWTATAAPIAVRASITLQSERQTA